MRTHLQRLTLNDVTPDILAELKTLYSYGYHGCNMHADLSEDLALFRSRPDSAEADVFRLLLVREDTTTGRIVGARAIELRDLPRSDYLDHPPLYGKRFTVLPGFRGHGIGRQLVAEGKRYAFDERGFDIIFGSSGELGALSMYGREGAMYHAGTIDNLSDQNNAQQNREFFAIFVTDPRFRALRTPNARDVRFAYGKDEATRDFLRANGHISRDELLSSVKATLGT